ADATPARRTLPATGGPRRPAGPGGAEHGRDVGGFGARRSRTRAVVGPRARGDPGGATTRVATGPTTGASEAPSPACGGPSGEVRVTGVGRDRGPATPVRTLRTGRRDGCRRTLGEVSRVRRRSPPELGAVRPAGGSARRRDAVRRYRTGRRFGRSWCWLDFALVVASR